VKLRERLLQGLAISKARELGRRGVQKSSTKGKADGPRVNLADPEAVVMKGAHGFVAGYNAQAAVDGKAQIIVGAELVADGTDTAQLPTMLKEVKETAGGLAMVTACDAGYHSGENLEAMQAEATNWYAPDPESRRRKQPEKAPFHKDRFQHNVESDTYTCPEGKPLRFAWEQKGKDPQVGTRVYRCRECQACRHFGTCTRDRKGRGLKITARDGLLRQHREKMRGEAGKFWVKMRATLVEPAFGIIKEHLGMTRFLRRGKENAKSEWLLTCAAYNLNKIIAIALKQGTIVTLAPI
jgi:hypothetical protein